VARGRDVRTSEQRRRAARGQSGRDPCNECPSRTVGRGRGERQRSSGRIDRHGRPAPPTRLHGAEVLELDDRSVVALFETSLALSAPARQRCDRPPAGGVLRRRTQPRASAFGISWTDARRDVFWHRGHGAGRPAVASCHRPPSTRRSQPVGILQDVPVSQRRGATPGAARRGDRELGRLGSPSRNRQRPSHERGRPLSDPVALCLSCLQIQWRELARGSPECP
jgi:hypothetical protein